MCKAQTRQSDLNPFLNNKFNKIKKKKLIRETSLIREKRYIVVALSKFEKINKKLFNYLKM